MGNYKPRDNLFEADNRVLNFSFKWHSREWKNPKINVCINMFSYYFTISVFAEVCDSIVSSCQLEMPSETQNQCVFLKIFEDLTNRFWEDYRKFLTELDGMDATFTNEFLQVIFADFRGVVISDETIKFKEGGDIDKTFDWAEEIIDDLRPIVTQNDSFECAANYVAQRRAIYLTALGPQLLNDPPSLSDDVKGSGKAKPRIPLTYLFCVAPSYQFSDQTVRSRELGRLLDLMHHVGTLRLAALIDLKLLRKASEKLRGIDIYTTIARAAIEDYANEKSNPVEMDQKIDKARSEFVKIAQDFFKYNQAGVGLTFRIESSEFYQSQFEKNVKALGLSSIRGYQKHDDFIARRLGQTFEFINRLGTRYERTVRVIRSLDQSASAIRAATTGETVAKTNISVEKIQRDGAAVLFMVLVPYYLQGSYHYFTHLERFEQIGFIPIILLSLSLAAFQTEKGQNLLKRKGSTVVYFNTFICIVLITLTFAAWVPKNGLKHEGNTPSSLTPEQFRPAPAPAGNLEH